MGTIYRRGRSYYASYTHPRTGERIRESLRTRDRSVAIERLRAAELAATDPRAARASTATLGDCARYLFEAVLSSAPEATRRFYSIKVRWVLHWFGADRDPTTITIGDVREYQRWAMARPVREGSATPVTPHTVAKEMIALRRLLLVAHEERPLAVHPRDVVPSAPTRYRPRERHLSAADFGRLLEAAPEHRRLWLLVAAYTGACLGELERLEWQHVDLRRGVVTIPGTKRETRYRTIPLSAELAPWLSGAPGRRGLILGRWGNVRRDLALYCERARIAVVTPNDLRRTYASWLVDAGVPTHTVATLLGHSSSRMVERVYGRPGIDHLAAAVARLPRCDAGVTSSVPVVSRSARPVAAAASANGAESRQVVVPRDGVEPPTRGFSVRVLKGGK
ncbi:MAG: tyrosine-type recombinase/integrase [Beijerinckiaceae bacterium]